MLSALSWLSSIPLNILRKILIPSQLTKQVAWVLAAALRSQQPTSGTAPLWQNTSSGLSWMDATSPTVGKKEQLAWAIGKVPMKTVLTQTCPPAEKRLFLSRKGNLTHNSNSPSKAPLSLSEQDPLWVFPMVMELHGQREEVGKVSITDMGLHMKRISALSLRSLLFPQPNPLPYCLTNTRLKKHHTGHQYGMTCVSHLAPKLCKWPLVTLRSIYQHWTAPAKKESNL